MLVSVIKSRFLTEYDEFQSDYISPAKMSNIFWHAQNNVFNNNLIPAYQSTKRITEDLLPIKKTQTLTSLSNNTINLTQQVTDFNSLIWPIPTYISGGITYTNIATLLLDVDRNSVYAQGDLRYPKYTQNSNDLNETILILQPLSEVPTQVEIEYFRTPIAIDFEVSDYDIPYGDNVIGLIIDSAKQIAAEAFRDPEFFNTSTAMLNQDNTPVI